MIVVRKHKGRSGQSVFEWRVYHVVQDNAKTRSFQLGKYRTKERAETAADHYRSLDLNIRQISAALEGV